MNFFSQNLFTGTACKSVKTFTINEDDAPLKVVNNNRIRDQPKVIVPFVEVSIFHGSYTKFSFLLLLLFGVVF